MEKICTVCKNKKVLEDFTKSSRSPSGYTNRCKACQCKLSHKYYLKDPKESIKRGLKNRRLKMAQLQEYKKTLKCADCGMSEHYCLDFHHKNPKDKSFEITYGALRNYKWERLMSEIAKCVVLCANCHRRRHYNKKVNERRIKEKKQG